MEKLARKIANAQAFIDRFEADSHSKKKQSMYELV
jgi:hypothetical protein